MESYFTSFAKIQQFKAQLKAELKNGLPGVDAHLRLAPEVRINELKTGQPPDNALESAVLIVLYPVDDCLKTVVILRNEYNGTHSGQISLPGGKAESSDIDYEHTALREAREEIGIVPDNMEILGQLSRFYVRPSNFIVYPFVAFSLLRPVFYPDPVEVQRIIELDVFNDIGYDKTVIKTLTFKNNYQVTAPGFIVGGEFMWGATAMMFSELIQVLHKVAEKIN